jgi:hypothetical protein
MCWVRLGALVLGSVVTVSVKGVQGQHQQGQGKSVDKVDGLG